MPLLLKMKKRKTMMRLDPLKKIFAAAAAICVVSLAVMPVLAEETTTEADDNTFTDNVMTYRKAEGGVYISDCESRTSSVNISGEVDGYKVIGIDANAFSDCTKLTEINLPDTITDIGESAFAGCTSLKKANIPGGMTKVPDKIFALCSALREVDIPESVTEIGEYAFSYCDDLTWFEIPETITAIGNYAFAYSNMGETLEIPEGVESIGALSFYYCQGLKTAKLPSTLESIGTLAFLGCNELSAYEVSESNNTWWTARCRKVKLNNSIMCETK